MRLAFVGCFTTELRNAHGAGISIFRITASGWQAVGTSGDLLNPSCLLADRSRNLLFAAHGDADYVTSYSVDPDSGKLAPRGEALSGGVNGVALALHPSGQFLFVANYASGTVTTVPVRPDGTLQTATQRFESTGALGPNRDQQSSAHPHDVVIDPSGRFLIMVEKGLDRIVVLKADGVGKLTEVSHAKVRPGAGPRHIAFHPNLPRAFVVDELDSTIVTLRWDAKQGVLTPLSVAPGLPATFFKKNRAAEILCDRSGRFVYVSQRGLDAVAHFALEETGDGLRVIGFTPTGGGEPRFMILSPDGESLLVTNQDTDAIVEFAIDPKNGKLARRHTIPTPSPATIAFF